MSNEMKQTNTAEHSTDPSERCDAIIRFAAYPPVQAVEFIAPYLEDAEPIVVESAVRALAMQPGGVVLSHVTPLLLSPKPSMRMTVVEIARRVALDTEAKEILKSLCIDGDDDVRLFALDIILAHTPDDMLDLLLKMRFDRNPNVALKAIECLGGFNSEKAVQALAEELQGGVWRRTAAIEALGRSPMEIAMELLLELQVTVFDDLLIVLHAISTRADYRAIPYLLRILSDCDTSLLPHVLKGLVAICSKSQGTEMNTEHISKIRKLPFKQYFEDDRTTVRKAAISLSAALGTKDHLIIMVEHFAKADSDERTQIVESIAAMPIQEAEEILEILSRDEDPAVAVRALEHLRKGHA